MGQQAASGRSPATSAWPVFVALGLALGELGVLFGVYPVAVAGLLLFLGSVTAVIHEAGYVARPWQLLGVLGALLLITGTLLVYSQVGSAPRAALSVPDGITARGLAIAGSGAVALVAGGVGTVVDLRGGR